RPRNRPPDEGQEREGVREPLLGRLELRNQDEEPPESVDDGGHRREQVDHHGQRPSQPPRTELRYEQRRRDRDRHSDRERDRGRDQRPDHERQGPEHLGADVPVVAKYEVEHTEALERRTRLYVETHEEVPDQDEDRE